MRMAVPTAERALHWVATRSLEEKPLTGLARKILMRMKVMKPKVVASPAG